MSGFVKTPGIPANVSEPPDVWTAKKLADALQDVGVTNVHLGANAASWFAEVEAAVCGKACTFEGYIEARKNCAAARYDHGVAITRAIEVHHTN